MVENFKLITEDLSLNIDVGKKINLYESNSKELVIRYFNSATKGLSWISQGRTYSFLEKENQIKGFPTVDQLKVVIIYPSNHKIYPAPNNSVLYNCDGKLLLRLKAPELISSIAKERKRRTNVDLISTASFREVYWYEENGNTHTVVTIDFDWEWWETRVLNTETGEFGECVNSGRR